MDIYSAIKYLKSNGIALSRKEESVLTDYFKGFDRVAGVIKSSRDLIVKASTLDEHCFVLHESGIADKECPTKTEVFFGLYISPFGSTQYIIAFPLR